MTHDTPVASPSGGIGFFERYLTLWVGLCIAAGIALGRLAPALATSLVVPRAEVDHWIDLDGSTADHLFRVAHSIGRAQQRAFGCERVGLIIAGYEVPHTHLHVVPTNHLSELSFAHAASSVDRADLVRAADAIVAALAELGLQPNN